MLSPLFPHNGSRWWGFALPAAERRAWPCLAVPELSVQPGGHPSCTPAAGYMENHLPGHLPGEQHTAPQQPCLRCLSPGVGQCSQQEQGLGCSRARTGHAAAPGLPAPGALRAGLPSSNFPLHWASLCSPRSSRRAIGLLPSLSSWHRRLIALSCHTRWATHRRRLARAARHLQPCSLPNAGLPPLAWPGKSWRALGRAAPALGPTRHCLCPHRQR